MQYLQEALRAFLMKGMIPMNNSVAQYERAVKKKLACGGSERMNLLERLRLMLDSYLEENPSPTAEELYAAFGPPEAMAGVLSDGISPEEKARYHRSKKLLRVIAVAVAAVLLLVAIYVFFIKQKPLNVVDEGIIYPEITDTTTTMP